jgi:hypothetical protein
MTIAVALSFDSGVALRGDDMPKKADRGLRARQAHQRPADPEAVHRRTRRRALDQLLSAGSGQ